MSEKKLMNSNQNEETKDLIDVDISPENKIVDETILNSANIDDFIDESKSVEDEAMFEEPPELDDFLEDNDEGVLPPELSVENDDVKNKEIKNKKTKSIITTIISLVLISGIAFGAYLGFSYLQGKYAVKINGEKVDVEELKFFSILNGGDVESAIEALVYYNILINETQERGFTITAEEEEILKTDINNLKDNITASGYEIPAISDERFLEIFSTMVTEALLIEEISKELEVTKDSGFEEFKNLYWDSIKEYYFPTEEVSENDTDTEDNLNEDDTDTADDLNEENTDTADDLSEEEQNELLKQYCFEEYAYYSKQNYYSEFIEKLILETDVVRNEKAIENVVIEKIE